MKNILGLDLGTNSIGWAMINASTNEEGKDNPNKIIAAGSRIIPMDAAILGDFDKGNTKSPAAERTRLRGVRRLFERCVLRRERLLRVLSTLNFLPSHFAQQIDRYGKFCNDSEPKLAWAKDETGKYQFIFQDSFKEMLADFARHQPELIANNKRIPYDWTIYYLRKKALTQKISKEELAWILLNFNQKRGYYQLRNEEEEKEESKLVEFHALKVVSVEPTKEKRGSDIWYNVHLENGWIYRRSSKIPLDWEGQIKEFIVTTDLEKDGSPKVDKEGNIKRSFRAPKDDDWTLLKKKTEADIKQSGKMIGAYIYDTLLENPKQKIKGKLVATIDRDLYKKELTCILETQVKFHPELQDKNLYQACLEELYPNNEAHRRNAPKCNFLYLFRDDILFYQRPLKSKKSLIDNCPYEERTYINKETGEILHAPVKCMAKSHPLFQEFRIWQFISNLRIYERTKVVNGKLQADVNVTNEFLRTQDDYANLFSWLNDRKEIDQKMFFSYFVSQKIIAKKDIANYRWNYVEDKTYPCSSTRALLLSYLKKANIDSKILLEKETEESLWHLLYSISDKKELKKALLSFAAKHELENPENSFVDAFINIPTFKETGYAAYSYKAIKKLLPLMRMGKYWEPENIDATTLKRIENIINGEYDETIKDRVREKALHLTEIKHFQGLPLWLAAYIVYNRHSEAKNITAWKTPDDIENFLNHFRQHSLRNPIVEQIILETLRTVRDIWIQYGKIDEIHVELGREMKNSNAERLKITLQNAENENTNLRIKALLSEFTNEVYGIENVRPFSPTQQELFRIYEEGVLNSQSEIPEDIQSILKKFKESDAKKRPSHSDVMRYKLWLEQKYRSPYTGTMIPLGKLFTPAYEIEHVIPQSLYFDNSLSNKVICESAVNKEKSNMLGYEFIQSKGGQVIETGNGGSVKIFSTAEYEAFVKEHYSRNKTKMRKLLMEEIPSDFNQRQLNDSRYISKVIKMLLSNIVRDENEEEETSKHIIVCNGAITDKLKKDWGVNDVWNKIILPRFKRMNELTGTNQYTSLNTEGKIIPAMPLEQQKGFNKKRIDHRHHAMDAIVIACTNRNIVNSLNNVSAAGNKKEIRQDLRALLCSKKQIIDKPWDNFTQDVYATLNNITVSFKQNLRVITKATNKYLTIDKDGRKVLKQQTKGNSQAIRKPMHKETVFGEINLRRIKTVPLKDALKNLKSIVNKDFKNKLSTFVEMQMDVKSITKYFEENKDSWQDINLKKIEVYYFTKETKDRFFASRETLNDSFNQKKIEDKVADTGIQKILLRHLKLNDNKSDLAFSPEGIERMNLNIRELNNGKYHQPIYKVRIYEKAEKFPVGQTGNKSSKFVEAAKGTNLFFAVYENEIQDKKTGLITKKRSFATIPLNTVIERKKQGLPVAPENEFGHQPLFVLSPNSLVYLPTQEEIKLKTVTLPIDKKRIYKMVSSSGNQCFFIKNHVASSIVDKQEFSSLNKMERALSGEMIKETCIPVQIDRLGNIKPLFTHL